ncbi:MAG: iron-containing alcohol dehydrogenase, partial [Firmicutes bacterium]|nr:iron-containing alcohol dehydrogenase [Bacillota bacterium]
DEWIGEHRLFLVCDSSLRFLIGIREHLDQLELNGNYIMRFNDFQPNPLYENVLAGVKQFRRGNCDAIMAIGGGSAIDVAKCIKLYSSMPGDGANGSFLTMETVFAEIPFLAMPTTAGTGSEVTQYSILTIHEKNTKKSISHAVFPTLALDDPKYLVSLSHEKLIDTAVDTLAHLIESRLSANCAKSLSFTEEGLKIWGELKFKILENTLTDIDRESLIRACVCGGNAIAQTSTSLPHGLSYMATYKLGIPHGRACGMFLGGYLDTYPDREKAQKTAELLGFEDTKGFREFISFLLSEKPLDGDFMRENAQALLQNPAKLKNHPYDVDADKLLRMENTYDKTV